MPVKKPVTVRDVDNGNLPGATKPFTHRVPFLKALFDVALQVVGFSGHGGYSVVCLQSRNIHHQPFHFSQVPRGQHDENIIRHPTQ